MPQTPPITGPAYVLGDDVDTDQIIPAEYLIYDPTDPEERKMFGRYAMAGVPIANAGLPQGDIAFIPEGGGHTSPFKIVIGGKNFGCGSSREHAPLALAEAGIKAVVAEYYARIFFRNSVNGGYVLPMETPIRLVDRIRTGDACTIDVDANTLTHHPSGEVYHLKPVGDVKPIIDAGGVFAYARQTGMLK